MTFNRSKLNSTRVLARSVFLLLLIGGSGCAPLATPQATGQMLRTLKERLRVDTGPLNPRPTQQAVASEQRQPKALPRSEPPTPRFESRPATVSLTDQVSPAHRHAGRQTTSQLKRNPGHYIQQATYQSATLQGPEVSPSSPSIESQRSVVQYEPSPPIVQARDAYTTRAGETEAESFRIATGTLSEPRNHASSAVQSAHSAIPIASPMMQSATSMQANDPGRTQQFPEPYDAQVRLQGESLTQPQPFASELAMKLLSENKILNQELLRLKRDLETSRQYVADLEKQLLGSEENVAQAREKIVQLESDNQDLLAQMRVAEMEHQEYQQATEATLNEIESNLNRVLFRTMSEDSPPPQGDK